MKGLFAGEGRYENWCVASKYSVDPAYLECHGAFTLAYCSEAGATAPPSQAGR